jgi:hypothetical protein
MARAAPSAALVLLLSCSLLARVTSGSASLDTVSTLAGTGTRGWADGPSVDATFSGPYGVAVGADGTLYVADAMNHAIRTVAPGSGAVATLAGGGPFKYGAADGAGVDARFAFPTGVAVGSDGVVYAADSHNNRVVKITADGVVSTLAGGAVAGSADGTGTTAQFSLPKFLAVDAAHNVYVTDMRNHRVRKISAAGVVTTVAGSEPGFADGDGMRALFNLPQGIAVDAAGFVYVGDYNNNAIRKISPSGAVTTMAGGKDGWLDATGVAAKFDHPADVAVDAAGNVYVAGNGNRRVRRVSPGGVVTTIAGSGVNGAADGAGDGAAFSGLWGIAVDAAGSTVYIADASNNKIRTVAIGGAAGAWR